MSKVSPESPDGNRQTLQQEAAGNAPLAGDEHLTELVQTKAQLDKARDELRIVAKTEKEAADRELKKHFIRLLSWLLVFGALGLGGGVGWSKFRNAQKEFDWHDYEGNDIPRDGLVAEGVAPAPVSFGLFQRFARAVGSSAEELGVKPDGEVAVGVSGITALNFCNWLTEVAHKQPQALDENLCFTLPTLEELGKIKPKDKDSSDWKEWSQDWDETGQVLKMRDKNGVWPVHVLCSSPEFTFRIALKKIPKHLDAAAINTKTNGSN